MGVHLLPFIAVSVVIVITPGPDTLLVTRNALVHGRGAALGTVAGISLGLVAWIAAACLGIAALLRESAVAFDVLKIAGAVYLVWLGIGALRAAHARSSVAFEQAAGAARASPRNGLRQGLLCNLGNPKIAIFFTSLLPQFVSGHRPGVAPFLVLGGVFALLGLAWLTGYALLAARLATLLRRPTVRAALDAISGVVLVAVGVRLALERW